MLREVREPGLGPLDGLMALVHGALLVLPVLPLLTGVRQGPELPWPTIPGLFGGWLAGVVWLAASLALTLHRIGARASPRPWLGDEDRSCLLVLAMGLCGVLGGALAGPLAVVGMPVGVAMGAGLAGGAVYWPRPMAGLLVAAGSAAVGVGIGGLGLAVLLAADPGSWRASQLAALASGTWLAGVLGCAWCGAQLTSAVLELD